MTQPVDSSKIIMYGTSWCGDCRRARTIFDKHAISYVEIDIDEHPEAVPVVMRINNGKRSVPTIVFPDGSTLTEPSNAQLTDKLTS